jgi:hypothetical protein
MENDTTGRGDHFSDCAKCGVSYEGHDVEEAMATHDMFEDHTFVRPMVPSIQVEILDADDNEVTDPAIALLAMREALGAPGYESELEDLGDGLWLVSLPADAASELKLNGYWGRENEGGFNVTAEWPS